VVQPEDSGAIERLVRYVMRSPVSQDRLAFDHQTGEARLEPKAGADDGADADQVERLDGDELVARVIVQIPDPKRHLIRSYGRYANAAGAKRKREAMEGAVSSGASGIAGSALPATEPMANEPDSAERKAARKRWANLIRHIYEGRASYLSALRRSDEDHLLHHRTADHSSHSRVGAAQRHSLAGRLAPPPAHRSPGRRGSELNETAESIAGAGPGLDSGSFLAPTAV
jgi:hypothetical protein